MSRHYKKPIVRPEKAREWLGRYESGEALKTIAQKDHFDIRTVKRQVEEAVSERDMREARQTVLRAALEKHFNDIVALAESMRSQVTAGTPISLDAEAIPLLDGLKEHLSRSPLWLYMDRWHKGLRELEQLQKRIREKLEVFRELPTGSGIRPDLTILGPDGVVFIEVKKPSQGGEGHHLERDFRLEPVKDDKVDVCYGPLHIAETTTAAVPKLREFLPTLEEKTGPREELDDLIKLQPQLRRTQANLKDELNVIILRRVVPGRCRYCPY